MDAARMARGALVRWQMETERGNLGFEARLPAVGSKERVFIVLSPALRTFRNGCIYTAAN